MYVRTGAAYNECEWLSSEFGGLIMACGDTLDGLMCLYGDGVVCVVGVGVKGTHSLCMGRERKENKM